MVLVDFCKKKKKIEIVQEFFWMNISSYSTCVCDVCWWKAAFLQYMSGYASKGSRIGTRLVCDNIPP